MVSSNLSKKLINQGVQLMESQTGADLTALEQLGNISGWRDVYDLIGAAPFSTPLLNELRTLDPSKIIAGDFSQLKEVAIKGSLKEAISRISWLF